MPKPIIYQPAFFSGSSFHAGHFLWLCLALLAVACRYTPVEDTNYTARADSIINRTDSLLNAGKASLSLHFIDSAYQSFPDAGPIDLWKKYRFLSKIYVDYKLDTVKARTYIDSMLLVLKGREQIYKTEFAHTLFARGDLLLVRKKYIEAFRSYYDGRNYAQKNLDTCSLAQFTNKLAMVRYQQMQMPEAILYFKQALMECSHCQVGTSFEDYLLLPQHLMHMTGLAYLQVRVPHRADSTFFYYKQGLALIDQREHLFPEQKTAILGVRGILYGDLGEAYLWNGYNKEAEFYLNKGQQINEQPGGHIMGALSGRIDLATLYINTAAFPQAKAAIDLLEQGVKGYEGTNWDELVLWENLYSVKKNYFDKIHQVDSAYYYLQKLTSYVDSVRRADKGLRTSDMEDAFKDNGQQDKLALLNRNNRLKSFILLAVVIVSVMSVVILLLVWANLKRSRRVNKLISMQNKEISEQNEEILVQNEHISKQNDDMHQALRSLEQSQADNTRMMKIAAHDLRNPIGGIISIVALMQEEPERTEEDRMLLELLKTSGINSLEIVSSLLEVHFKSDELKKEPVELDEMLQYCVSLMAYKAEAKGQHITLQANPYTLQASAEKLWRVMSNLIANAIKFSPDGSTISVKLEVNSQGALIAVKDHGIGIPEVMSDRIFDMFTDAQRQGTAGEKSFGLGLAISKQIVEAHNGRIWFESNPGDGTTFFVELPVVDDVNLF